MSDWAPPPPDATWPDGSRPASREGETAEGHPPPTGDGLPPTEIGVTPGASPGVSPAPHPGAPPAGPDSDARRAADLACDAYDRARRDDPLFAPHAALAFEAGAELGQGGMGIVRRVHDRRLGRDGALKTLRPELRDDDATRRYFFREARITARLEHPAIPSVYEAGTAPDGSPYLFLRLIDGEPLDERIARLHGPEGPADRGERDAAIRDLVEVIVKTGDAIAYAHDEGVVHRDLKPANVMVGRFGEVMVLDWGLARALHPPAGAPAGGVENEDEEPTITVGASVSATDVDLSVAGSVIGTPGYMPPEQASGEKVGPSADVFALGALLHEALTGHPPVRGSTPLNRISATIQGKITRPRQLEARVPAALDAVAAAALAADPADRTPNAEALVADLRAWLDDEPPSVHRPSIWERLLRGVRRRPTATVGSALAVLVGGLAVAVASSVAVAEQERASAETERASAEAEAAAVQTILAGLTAAEARARAGASGAEVGDLVDRALELAREHGAEEAIVIPAASACAEGGLFVKARALLELAVDRPDDATAAGGARDALRSSRAAVALAMHHEVERIERAPLEAPRASDWMVELVRRADAGELPDGDELVIVARARLEAARPEPDLDAVIALCERALQAAPRRAPIHWLLGWALLEQGRDLPRAFEAATRAVALDPADLRNRFLRARAVVAQPLGPGQPRLTGAHALRDVALLIEAFPDSRAIARLRLDVAVHNDATAWIIRYATDLLALDGGDDAEHVELRALRARKQLELATLTQFGGDKLYADARADYDAILARRPNAVDALVGRAHVRARTGDPRGALADAELALAASLTPRQEASARWARAVALDGDRVGERGGAGDAAAALAALEAAVAADPSLCEAWLSLGPRRLRAGDAPGALAALERAAGPSTTVEFQVVRERTKATAFIEVGRILTAAGRAQDAIAQYDEALRIAPAYVQAYYERGNIHLQRGDLDAAIRDFTEASDINAHSYASFNGRAVARWRKGLIEEASADFARALEIQPDDPSVLANRAQMRAQTGDLSGSQDDLVRFLEVAPNHPNAPAARQLLELVRSRRRGGRGR